MRAFHRSSRQSRRQRRRRPGLEQLETRRLLATLDVNSLMDAVDADPGDGLCEISAGGPCTLRAAIQEANALSGADLINLPAGTYTLSLEGRDEASSATGDLDIGEDLILQAAGAADTVIDAAGIDRVIDVRAGSVTISGVTIRGGRIQDPDAPVEGSGGGIRNEGNLNVSDSVLSGNVASFGAAVGNYNGTVRILRSVLTGNGGDATQRGGAVANYSNYDLATVEITDTTITNNQADVGGGISNRTFDGAAVATITRSTISGNTARDGGGISNRSVFDYSSSTAASMTIVGSTISGNTASQSGGGVHNEAGAGARASIDTSGSTITGNLAISGDGGGIANVPSSGVTSTMESVIISGNVCGGDGPDLLSESTTARFSLIQSPVGHAVSAGDGNNILGADPLLGPLQDNGGPTRTHLLLSGSPAIDQGSNPNMRVEDQRGSPFARTVDDLTIANASDGTDIGAVEVGQAGTPPPRVANLSLSQVVDDPNPVLGQDVTLTITVTNSGPDLAASVEVTSMLPSDLMLVRASVTQGSFDDFSGVWMIANLDPSSSATLNLAVTVEGSDPITTTAEVTASDAQDPNSTPGNGVAGEDDQASVTLGTCLTAAPLRIGLNQLTYSCANPGSFVAFVRGTMRGNRTFERYGTTVDIADAEEVALAVADSSGVAVGSFRVAQSELDQTTLVQAFQLFPGRRKSNTLSLESAPQPLATTQFLGLASSRLDVNGDQIVSALDALVIINHLQHPPPASPDSLLELDINADSRVSAIDALMLINRLGRVQESLVAPELSPPSDPTAWLTRKADEDLVGWAAEQWPHPDWRRA